MNYNDKILNDVEKLYLKYPYPSYYLISDNMSDYENLGKRNFASLNQPFEKLRGKKVLDAGCGTGEFSCYLAYKGADVLGIDYNNTSLARAKENAQRFGIKNIKFAKENILELNLTEKFDYVFCMGVLHHTSNPYRGFRNLLNVTKKNGFITLGLYSLFGRFFHNLRKNKILSRESSDIDKRLEKLDKKEESALQKVSIADQYLHPHEEYYTIDNILTWFKTNNVNYLGANPPADLTKYISMFKHGSIINLFKQEKMMNSNYIEEVIKVGNNDRMSIFDNELTRTFIQLGWAFAPRIRKTENKYKFSGIDGVKYFRISGQKLLVAVAAYLWYITSRVEMITFEVCQSCISF